MKSQDARRPDWLLVAWLAIAAIVALRVAIAWSLPLGEDEAYYWAWSRHLALGYIDHPPATAWLIAAFSWIGREPGAVRLGFILCGVVATLALADCVTRLSGDRAAGAVAALALNLAPFAYGTVSPDGPFIAFWALTLAATTRLLQTPTRANSVGLGLSLAGALLSKMFGLALLAGVIAHVLTARRRVWPSLFVLAALVTAAAYAPFLWWNARHHWITFVWTFVTRNGPLHAPSIGLASSVASGQLAVYSPGLWIAAVVALFAARSALVTWTAAPLAVLFATLSFFMGVQPQWMLGPYVSLCLAIGLSFVRLRTGARVWWMVLTALPAAAMLFLFGLAAAAPEAAAASYARAAGARAPDNGLFALFGYRSLALDARRIATERGAAVMSDEYGLVAAISYYADVPVVVIGTDVWGRESRNWATLDPRAPRALVISKNRLQSSSAFGAQLVAACARVRAGPVLRYRFAGAPAGVYYTSWCERPRPHAVRILRWENPPATSATR